MPRHIMTHKLPIIHLPNVAAQEKLFRDLYGMGYRYAGCSDANKAWADHNAIGYPYLAVYEIGTHLTFYAEPQSQYTALNSPRQFLAYLARISDAQPRA